MTHGQIALEPERVTSLSISAAYSVICCFVYPRSAHVIMAVPRLDPVIGSAIHENTVISNLGD
jgi:hypothetical protein